ncbi:hypothetical protein DOTSEDRAFT_66360 [Dothistroma septosporum NZE10]|uniref:Carboxylic ester hydrolase n=1 Tax=Dothistroma septosporum (strain NZE10 / CBS 128990) TaxID=675120 RepID=M2YK59_DOTSN|nr:hypothetical protein DOTSEDRAFT_66360 [Dothistroma septosporum NZE10]
MGSLLNGVTSALPTVDLGYTLQQPTSLNSQYDVYVFYDVRYAAPPTGNNRFRAPTAPATNRTVQKGGEQRACAQAQPSWQATTNQFGPKYAAGQTSFQPSDFSASPPATATPTSRETEDCLFLDLYVPRSVYNNAGKGSGVPVIVQIYGGGYVAGVKDLNPAGFFLRDQEQGGSGIIFVSINYRLGAFGWLAGSSFQKNGDANAGLLDQHFALQWVQKYISKFGGDPNNVTVIGESAGGGSIMHQITAYGGSVPSVPFQKAIVQSPGFFPQENDNARNQAYNAFLGLSGVATLAEARALSFDTVYKANALQVYNSTYGQFTYGPAVDGTFVPDLPGKLLMNGRLSPRVAVMVGHNADEGLGFVSPYVNDDASFKAFMAGVIPAQAATTSNLNYVADTLYPSDDYPNQIARTDAAISEAIFTCNTFYLDKGFLNKTYSYEFAVPPANHGNDVPFTYYTGENTPDPQVQVAVNMQRYFLNFARSGNPNGAGVPTWDRFDVAAEMKDFNTTADLTMIKDNTANSRCNWWQANL